jgi:4-diphosphocytidyl-2-C-methyl-D-erythritol kinase
MAINLTARAKVNLCLHVTGQRPDGYHLLDSLVVFADLGDRLTFSPAEMLSLEIGGRFGAGLSAGADNLILRAANLFSMAGAAIHLQKNLPVASGIGGGSADAAATLHGLSRLWQQPMPPLAQQLSLGADVPVCVAGKTLRMSGIGEVLTPLDFLPDLPAVLINPDLGVSTPQVFRQMQNRSNPPIANLPETPMDVVAFIDWLAGQRNDLQAAAISLVPQIADMLDALNGAGAALARMSGSGATCFGLFESQKNADQAARLLQQTCPDWWIQSTTLCGSNHAGHHEIGNIGQ